MNKAIFLSKIERKIAKVIYLTTMDPLKLNTAVIEIVNDFKKGIIRIINLEPYSQNDLLQFINDFTPNAINEASIMKKKRIKNVIPFHEKCIAKRANGQQCSRRKRKESEFCGTHNKACPHGSVSFEDIAILNNTNDGVVKKQIEVWLEDINGIMYWINDAGTVYHPDDIKNNIENPRIIAHYEKKIVEGLEIYNITPEIHA
jgi:hypothetical protein